MRTILGTLIVAIGLGLSLAAQQTPLTPFSNLGLRADNGALRASCQNCGPTGTARTAITTPTLILTGPGQGVYVDGFPSVLVVSANSTTERHSVWIDPASNANQRTAFLSYGGGNFTFRTPTVAGTYENSVVLNHDGIVTTGVVRAAGFFQNYFAPPANADYAMDPAGDMFIACTATTRDTIIKLPPVGAVTGRAFVVKKLPYTSNAFACNIDPAVAGTRIDSTLDRVTLGIGGGTRRFVSDGANWWLF